MISSPIQIGGLYVKGKSLYTQANVGVKGTLSHTTLKIGNGSISTKVTSVATEEAKTNYLSLSFADSLIKNLTIANNLLEEEKKRAEEDKKKLANSLVETAEEVRKVFGYAEANRFMATVITATETGFSEDRLAGAVTDFLNSVKGKAFGTMTKSGVTDAESATADQTLGKLSSFLVFLNNGSAEGKNSTSLASAMNIFFGREYSEEDDKKFFSADLKWTSAREQKTDEEAKNKAAALAAFIITREELGAEVIDAAVNYLSTTVASQQAAKILDDLKQDDDVFDAVDQVRSVLSEEDESAGILAETDAGAAAVAVSGGKAGQVLNEAVKSASKSALFNQFLDNYFLEQINKTIQNNQTTGGRLTTVASQKIGVEYSFGTIGLTAWPGLVGVSTSGVSVSIGFEREFSISVGKDNKIETKFSQSLKIEASFTTSSVVTIGSTGAFAAASYLTLAQSLEKSYISGKVGSNNQTPVGLRSSYLLSTLI
jgi:hypothetical protein